jgi:hypothetical protein
VDQGGDDMTLTAAQYLSKAATAATAWQKVVGSPPSKNALVLAMSVADLETGLGSVTGHNWGAVHARALPADEMLTLPSQGLDPADGNAALTTARTLLTPGKNEILVIDTSPRGAYFVWLRTFPNDEAAAETFLTVLVKHRPGVAAIIDTATPVELAAAMYASKYFEGNSTDAQTNINAYGALIANHALAINAALGAWTPPAPPAPPPSSTPTTPSTPSSSTPIASMPRARGVSPAVVALGLAVGVALFMGRTA